MVTHKPKRAVKASNRSAKSSESVDDLISPALRLISIANERKKFSGSKVCDGNSAYTSFNFGKTSPPVSTFQNFNVARSSNLNPTYSSSAFNPLHSGPEFNRSVNAPSYNYTGFNNPKSYADATHSPKDVYPTGVSGGSFINAGGSSLINGALISYANTIPVPQSPPEVIHNRQWRSNSANLSDSSNSITNGYLNNSDNFKNMGTWEDIGWSHTSSSNASSPISSWCNLGANSSNGTSPTGSMCSK